MSTAVIEAPAVEARAIRDNLDRGFLTLLGADLSETALIDEYYEYRSIFVGKGAMERANLYTLVVHQNRRKAKAKKDK